MRLPSGHGREPLELKMTPMIDVVFLLLVFFLWTSSFEEPEFLMPSAIADPPLAAGAEATLQPPPASEPFDEIIVRIQWTSGAATLLFNDQPLPSLDALRQRLQAILDVGVLPPVIVDPDPEVPMGDAIRVYDTARSLGFDRVLFAARADAAPPSSN
ncbi:ExbD/TolR family protein [Rosistilla oblonga]|uniref:ExbD/TolR family protein n=1 Tax=Rosistilla oblonga TaxID=2527990 RepID=UPI003A972793